MISKIKEAIEKRFGTFNDCADYQSCCLHNNEESIEEIMQLMQQEKYDLLERVRLEVIEENEDENRPHHTYDLDIRRRNELRARQRDKLAEMKGEE